MIEKHLILEDVDPAVFYGVQGSNWRMVKSLFPKLRLMARDNVVKAVGEADDLEVFDEKMQALVIHCAKYNSLTEEDILDILRGQKTKDESGEDVIVYSTHGIALAVRALKRKEVRRIILSRPAVEAGEKLGFLPGDMKEKIDPYLQPLYDALEEMIPAVKLKEYMDTGVIQIAPLAFMRGRTLNDAVVILDEAQNTTTSQIKMFLTRMGTNTKMIVTGDRTQIDLPASQRSGLIEALRILKDVPGIGFVELTRKDIVRHKLVTRIVEAYEAEARRRREEQKEEKIINEQK